MTLHLKLTMSIFFINTLLTLFFPQFVFLGDSFFISGDISDPNLGSEFESSIPTDINSEDTSVFNSLGFIDTFSLIINFVLFIVSLLLALPILIVILPISGVLKILFFFPILVLYTYTTIGWIRKG